KHFPFLISSLKKINETMSASFIAGDLDVAGFLLYLTDELQETIQASELSEEDKATLTSLFTVNTKDQLTEWSLGLVKGKDLRAAEKQKMVMGHLLRKYYMEIVKSGSDAILNDPKDFSMLMACLCRLEGIELAKEGLDPEVKERMQALLGLVLPHLKKV